ncbi:oxidoreductase [Alkalihalobacillus alcalophilus ATCC 27647 = CGMCC 1.3604]|uniref:Oxidoreductase n=1 Tax=Alkalihalobacillus alcalophilus ATCC 27647 = CGMCC 1.3604 TaxID=1218173 RepID=A0A094XEE3_ALKAL|nr:FAD-dependent oxidoreductase [Alkalihalobacillus alcalophilus]KGA97145.1 oxidoreductase [Alkalihalobacillus alcalophilus ATCC 27647 = CGMCC 1.3604]MED1563089.1 FAD-dependent oxidoreductase [Alkalihalobacillus alcalophilus]THG90569.1 oxidoreductase [Alkalihalobacillus alcalophilus ATCC 27647 = CGMCC 1.3604]
MSFLKDTLSIFKKNELLFLESYKEAEGVYTFLFEKEKDLTWKAGQHGLFSLTHKKIKNGTRPFSVASAPTEDVVKITTGISDKPSDFKKALLELEKGMKVNMSGPVGSFYLKDNRHSLLIAGGIGVTPFRAILKQLEAEGDGNEKQVKLLYLDSAKSYIYKDELDEMVHNNSIDVSYLESREELYQEIDKFITAYKNDGNYFIAGSKSMVDSITTHLKNHNISKRNIKKDAFWGIN